MSLKRPLCGSQNYTRTDADLPQRIEVSLFCVLMHALRSALLCHHYKLSYHRLIIKTNQRTITSKTRKQKGYIDHGALKIFWSSFQNLFCLHAHARFFIIFPRIHLQAAFARDYIHSIGFDSEPEHAAHVHG
jgi:hypothetical protein